MQNMDTQGRPKCKSSVGSSATCPPPSKIAIKPTTSTSSTLATTAKIKVEVDRGLDQITSSEESADETDTGRDVPNVQKSLPSQTSQNSSTSSTASGASQSGGRKVSTDFMVLEEITSSGSEDLEQISSEEEDDLQPISSDEEEKQYGGSKSQTESGEATGQTQATASDLDPTTRNEQDLMLLLQTLEANPEDKRICFYCFRVGHITVGCVDKKNKEKERKRCPIWLQGVRQRQYIFFDMNPKSERKAREYIRMKKKRHRKNRLIRQEKEDLEEVRKKRERLETAQELLEMAQKLMEQK